MNPDKPRALLKGKRVALLFYEASTRTRTSFEIAAKSLGAYTVVVHASGSSIEKGESLLDTGYTLRAVGADAIVIRHPNAGSSASDGIAHRRSGHQCRRWRCSRASVSSVARAYTILRNKKHPKGLRIAIIGDIFHSRVARSACHLWSKLGAKITLCGPPELVPEVAVTLAPSLRITRPDG